MHKSLLDDLLDAVRPWRREDESLPEVVRRLAIERVIFAVLAALLAACVAWLVFGKGG
jgi:hypothetical protein